MPDRKTRLVSLLLFCALPLNAGAQDDDVRDPTVPSPEIADRLRAPEQAPATPRQATGKAPRMIPELELKGLVFQSSDRGVAVLQAGERVIHLPLKRSAADSKIEVPTQWLRDFLPFEAAQRSAEANSSAANKAAAEQADQTFETLDLTRAFVVDDVLFSVVTFNESCLVLRVLPANTVVILR